DLEPSVHSDAGLLSPSSGIIDSHGLMLGFRADLELGGGIVALNCTVVGGKLCGTLRTDGFVEAKGRRAQQYSDMFSCQGALLLDDRASAISAPGLSIGERRRARHACDFGSGRECPVWPRRAMA